VLAPLFNQHWRLSFLFHRLDLPMQNARPESRYRPSPKKEGDWPQGDLTGVVTEA
jgi:hypothetical protein